MQNKCAHITLIVHVSLLKKLLSHLTALGINHLYSAFGRSVVLNETRGLRAIFQSSDLINEPVEVLYFYIPIEFEEPVMKMIVKICRLDIPGRGSIFSKHIQLHHGDLNNLICWPCFDKMPASQEIPGVLLFSNLTQIHCTMSRGLVDDVARLLLHLGIVPTITNSSGTGLRDQLGLLRITIPKEKELLSIVVGHHEASSIIDKMITWGKLDRPGKGFIWQVPVEKGLINFKTSQRSIGQAASTEQIIAAIDSVKGNFSWRQGGPTLAVRSKRSYFQGVELSMQVKAGDSLAISKAMIKLGISGVTVQSLKTLSIQSEDENIVVPQEVIKVVVTNEQMKIFVANLLGSQKKEHSFLESTHVFGLNVLRSFNYRNRD
jgi:nitrogen regulatory protein PII